jgi:transcriptional regulator with PAS, ATPase and Fis domain
MDTTWFFRKIYTVTSTASAEQVWNLMSDFNEPFVFITEDKGEHIKGYIKNTDLMPLLQDNGWERMAVIQLPYHCPVMEISEDADMLDSFRVFGEEVILISCKDDPHHYQGYLQREDILYFLLKKKSNGSDWIRSLLNSIPMGIIITDFYGRIKNFSSQTLRMLRMVSDELRMKHIGEVLDKELFIKVQEHGETILNQIIVNEKFGVLADFGPIRNNQGTVTGAIIVLQDLPYIEKMAMEFEYVKNLNTDMEAILTSIYDEILVVDKKGVLLRYSGNLIKDFWELDKEQLIGINLMELENEGTFFSAIVKMVLEKKKKISVTQESRSEKIVLAVGNPIFDPSGKLERIVIALRDVTETTILREELLHAKKLSEKYKKQLESLRDQKHFIGERQVIYRSEKIEKVMKNIRKVANVSSTVLLQGESGVGKEVFARAIHETGPRRNKPFIKVNCGAIPENLLESELFGYEKGAFTGANSAGKQGYFQLANNGILFLDEIGEMPVNLQVKLLRVLQEREVVPLGGSKVIEVDVQIIAATNKNLEKMVEEGKFREDLFYRLNVIPIPIPPLRERPEDIALLSLHFLHKFNEKYGRTLQLSEDAVDLLESYSWPGNVRELQNIIERISVTADEELVESIHIVPLLKKAKKYINRSKLKITPLKEATKALEEQLIKMAMDEYKTTSLAAKILGVSQSTVSRKYQEIEEKIKRGEKVGINL